MEQLDHLIAEFEPIALSEMDSVSLMKRTDTKYVFASEFLITLLKGIQNDYRVLSVNGVRSSRYRTLYLDTAAFDFYLQHQNGKLNRNKVRFREYVDSNLRFLEIKLKNNKGQTVKKRIRVDEFEKSLSGNHSAFVEKNTTINKELEAKLWNSFNRITLVNTALKERLTFDYNLHFEFDGESFDLPNVVIAELKQERINRNSPFAVLAKKLNIRDTRISKYCVGSAILNEDLKQNRFKQKLLTLKKISNELVA